MTIPGIAGWVVAVLAVAYCIRVYYELWKWARICQRSRIAIAFKRKVKLQAPLTEYIEWIKMLDQDKDSGGRTIYSAGGTTVIITRADATAKLSIRRARNIRRAKKENRRGQGPQAKQGTWKATDQTNHSQSKVSSNG